LTFKLPSMRTAQGIFRQTVAQDPSFHLPQTLSRQFNRVRLLHNLKFCQQGFQPLVRWDLLLWQHHVKFDFMAQ
jgi:hypothetical protein